MWISPEPNRDLTWAFAIRIQQQHLQQSSPLADAQTRATDCSSVRLQQLYQVRLQQLYQVPGTYLVRTWGIRRSFMYVRIRNCPVSALRCRVTRCVWDVDRKSPTRVDS